MHRKFQSGSRHVSNTPKRPSFLVEDYVVLRLDRHLAYCIGDFIMQGQPDNPAIHAVASRLIALGEKPPQFDSYDDEAKPFDGDEGDEDEDDEDEDEIEDDNFGDGLVSEE